MSGNASPTSVKTSAAPEAIGPYSQATLCDGWIFCSGQLGLDPQTGELVAGGIGAQTQRILDNLSAVLAAAGGGVGGVVRTTLYLTDMGDFPQVNEIYGRWLGEARPARVTVGVATLPKGAGIAIDAIARGGATGG